MQHVLSGSDTHAAQPAASALWWPAARLLLGLTLLLGLVYPLAVTGLAQWLFPAQAQGSLLQQQGRVVGSALIGQAFSKPGEFWGRPSATASTPYNGAGSGGSNLGPANPALAKAVAERIAALYQVPRVAAARQLDAGKLEQLVRQQAQQAWFGSDATARVNVLQLNLALAGS